MSNNGKLSLVVDTNLFFECKALHEISWDVFDSEEIDIVVTRPVQTEIDRHKKGTNGRTYRRALKTGAMFRSLLTNKKNIYDIDGEKLVIRASNPRVTLRLAPLLKPTYGQGIMPNTCSEDDKIVGCARALAADCEHKVLLLTHDTGPMATAKASGVKFRAIPDDWLLPPQDSSEHKKIKKLQEEIKFLRAAEPVLKLATETTDGSLVDSLTITEKTYIPLTQTELKNLMDELKSKNPAVSNYGPTEPLERTKPLASKNLGISIIEKFTPASQDEISSYVNTEYPNWIQACQSVLESIHDILNNRQPIPVSIFKLKNDGRRPANDLRIDLTCKGPVLIKSPEIPDEDEKTLKPLKLPAPPYPPQGQWLCYRNNTLMLKKPNTLDMIRQFGIMGRNHALSTAFPDMKHLFPPTIDVSSLIPPKHDPNGLYRHPSRPFDWEISTSLVCDQFRHGSEHSLHLEIAFEKNDGRGNGAIECKVQASNLSNPVVVTLPVTIKRVKLSPMDIARDLIKKLGSDIDKG